jgi:hypothetical protein
MTPEQRKLCWGLVITPMSRGKRQISEEEFLRQFPSSVEDGKLALWMLKEACRARSADDLESALIVGFVFGFAPEHKDILRSLVAVDWHHSHEDVVSALETWRTPDTVDAHFSATQWIPKYLDFDEARALARKAIWALGKIPGAEAEAKLVALARSDDAILRRGAEEQLERRYNAEN